MATKAKQAEVAEAIAQLREWIKPGDTVYTILDSVSRSGMSRQIRVIVPYTRHEARYNDGWREIDKGVVAITDTDHGGQLEIRCTVDHLHPNHSVGLITGYRQAKKGDGLIVGGCGMDMGYHLVYALSHRLWPDGFDCIGPGCPSNDHSNGDRDYTPGHRHHADGGYCLKHRWL
jgi:hypothetical protein